MTPRNQLLTVLRGPCIILTLNGSAVVEPLRVVKPRLTLDERCTFVMTYREPQG